MSERHRCGFRETTRLAAARERLLSVADPIDRTERVALPDAVGRSLAETVTAARDVPHYDRAAMDGYAVLAADTVGATDRRPTHLALNEEDVAPGSAVPVHTGSAVPAGADAVLPLEYASDRADGVDVSRPVAVGENVAPRGEDVTVGARLFEAGHTLRPADVGLCKSVGVASVAVRERPTVHVVTTGEELVDDDPDPGQTVATNGLTVAQSVAAWGGTVTGRQRVDDEPASIRAAVEAGLESDVVVTTGGTSVGRRDEVPEVVANLGEVLVHGIALKPGHPVGFGVVEETPVVMLPGYPVSAIVTAVQLLRPALAARGRLPVAPPPVTEATLARKLPSEPGVRTFARVRLESGPEGPRATPTRTSGAGVLSSVTEADGWVEVPEATEGLAAGAPVSVQHWEWVP